MTTPLFNLKIGNDEAEEIICNGQAVREVWVNGRQVYDVYDPANVPNGENRTTSANVSATYDDWPTWFPLNIAAKATGSMSLKINSISTPNIISPNNGYLSYANLAMVHPKDGTIAQVGISSITDDESKFKWRRAYLPDRMVDIQTGGGEIGNYATIAWDFHNQRVTINGSNYAWTPKWREGITFQYNLQPCWYESNSGGAKATMSATYSITV
jgi:hypothetical protein